ncbi:hypothetical protein DAEQUDRAFT_721936 [Daedalea quercina L-15889]|uniref:Uncharacterized protein n=1 Tax=Daedalea quercina L-15889 TaxID=1314783 RepID=A0A165TEV4_9APHY|nr:hypothetical protein DAEQUDRAFT_721936 [Daedalea quercina L-15889]
MEGQTKAKVTTRVDYDRTRPPSPFKPQGLTLSPPVIKPKAKINSSATVVSRKVQAPKLASPAPSARGPPSARAPSPFKPAHAGLLHSTSATSVSSVKARITARPTSQQSPTTGPDARQRSLTTVPSDSALSCRGFGMRPRRGSISSHTSLSASPTHVEFRAQSNKSLASPSEENGSPFSAATKGITRVKSKASSVAGNSPHTSPPASTKPTGHARGLSIQSISLAAPLLPADINASSILTSPHPPSTPGGDGPIHRHAYQPLTPFDDVVAKYSNYSVTAKVDPAAIPLPPQSPPMSTISFSSRSSASRSSVSYDTHGTEASRSTAPTVHSRLNGHSKNARASMDGLDAHSDVLSLSEDESWDEEEVPSPSKAHTPPREDPDRKVKDEAKSNRKIADLEITNKSLLAINVTLEAAKHRQAKEIRELKRKLRESRLILPPPAYRAVKSSLPHDDTAEEEEEEEEEEEGEDEEEERAILEGKDDEPYRRVKLMMETLLETCQRALQTKPEDFVENTRGGAKVLSAEEVRSWRGDDTLDDIDPDTSLTEDRDDESTQMEMSGDGAVALLNAMRQGAETRPDGEDEVEASLLISDDGDSSTVPPITVTPSP